MWIIRVQLYYSNCWTKSFLWIPLKIRIRLNEIEWSDCIVVTFSIAFRSSKCQRIFEIRTTKPHNYSHCASNMISTQMHTFATCKKTKPKYNYFFTDFFFCFFSFYIQFLYTQSNAKWYPPQIYMQCLESLKLRIKLALTISLHFIFLTPKDERNKSVYFSHFNWHNLYDKYNISITRRDCFCI